MVRILIALLALCFTVPAYAEDEKPAAREDTDKKMPLDNEFLTMAAECCNCMCSMCDLVEKRASRQEVKEFAKKISDEHKTLAKDLNATIKDKKLTAVEGPNKKDKQRLVDAGKLEGKEFDTAFLKNVIADHEKGIAACDNQIKNGKDEKATEFATTAVKKLREHLKEAKKLQAE